MNKSYHKRFIIATLFCYFFVVFIYLTMEIAFYPLDLCNICTKTRIMHNFMHIMHIWRDRNAYSFPYYKKEPPLRRKRKGG